MKPGKTNVETSHVEPSGINHFTPKWVSIEVKLGPGVSLTLYIGIVVCYTSLG